MVNSFRFMIPTFYSRFRSLTIAFLLLFLIAGKSNAQKAATDSLKQLLVYEKQDTSRVLLLMQLSKIYLENKPDTSLLLYTAS